MTDRSIFATLTNPRRVWAVSSVHGEVDRLSRLHEALWQRMEPGDRLVYLGNMLGHGPAVRETVDELLSFRRAVMTLEPAEDSHVVYLRGSQEEMWQKLLQIQFATDPRGVLDWMLGQGLGATLESYGCTVEEARRVISTGAVGLTRWTQSLRQRIYANPGHNDFLAAIKRAAMTDDGSLLFVNSGLDPSRPLETQRDSFWWNSGSFADLDQPYAGYSLVLRGFERSHPGLEVGAYTATLDGGCGFGGPLLAAALLPGTAEIVEVFEA